MIDLVNRPLVRLLMVGLPALGLQTTLFSELTPYGVVVQLLLCMSIGAGVAAGPEGGAFAGFVLGLMFDFVLTSPLGLCALIYGLAGFVGGFAFSPSLANPKWLNSLTCAGLGAASVFGVTLMIQQDTKPPLQPGDPASSVLNRVEYGNRG